LKFGRTAWPHKLEAGSRERGEEGKIVQINTSKNKRKIKALTFKNPHHRKLFDSNHVAGWRSPNESTNSRTRNE
jgi:hypothetical protein